MKNILRTELRNCLKQITQTELDIQSNNVLNTFINNLQLNKFNKIALYMNFDDSEIRTNKLIEKLFELNKRVFLPKVIKIINDNDKTYNEQKFKLQFLEVKTYNEVQDLIPRGRFKIREPEFGNDIMNESNGFDLIILPGLAFTKDLFRMGHGAGLYDDFIKRHSINFPNSKPYLLGIGLNQQLVNELPLEDHDEKLNGLIINNQFFN